jgi:hypothetical protein
VAQHRREQAAQRGHRDAERSKGDRGGVGDERERGGHDRLEAQARQHGGGDGDRRAEARDAFDERAEAERHEEQLDAAIAGQPGKRPADDVEVAALHRQVVEEDRADHDPADRPQPEGHPVSGGRNRQRQWHPPLEPCEDERRRRRGERGAPRRDAEHCEQQRQEERRDRCDERREEHAAADRVVDLMK